MASAVQRDWRRDFILSCVSLRQTSTTAVLGALQRYRLSHNSHADAEAFGIQVPSVSGNWLGKGFMFDQRWFMARSGLNAALASKHVRYLQQ